MERETTEVILAACPTPSLHISGWPFELGTGTGLLPGSSFLQKPFTAVELLRNVLDLLTTHALTMTGKMNPIKLS